MTDTVRVQAVKRFSAQCIKLLATEIKEAGGNEVFAIGRLDDQGLVDRITVRARGNEEAVLAPHGHETETVDVIIHNHPSGFLIPSDNDLAIAGRAAGEGVGCYIVDNRVSAVYVVAEPVRRRKRALLDGDRICAALEEGGAIAVRLRSYESRPSQLALVRLIVRAFNEDALTAAEAGTGVGKSFAYLLPAMSFALANEERVVISTATITLQQQLFDKDIPLVAAALDKKIKAVLIKGRGNYLCRRRLLDALGEPDIFDDEKEGLKTIAAWTETSGTGARSDLSFQPPDSLWSRVCSEADLCMGMRCPERERCFVMALRKAAADARILVVNHHLLFADLAARLQGAGYEGTVVLPPYTRIVVDEAHTIEGAATSFFSREFSRLGLYRQLGRLYRKRRARQFGLLVRVAALAVTGDKLDDGAGAVRKVRDAADNLDEAALELCGKEGAFRFTPVDEGAIASVLVPRLLDLRGRIGSLSALIRDMLENLPENAEDDPGVWEIKSIVRRLETAASVCLSFIEYKERPAEVMWIERRAGRGGNTSKAQEWAAFTATPIDVAPSLEEALFRPNKTVVCLSATLTINDSFAYWGSRSGLNLLPPERRVLTGQFPSPFPYTKSVLLAIPTDAPLPEQGAYQTFVNEAAARLTETSGGSALVLFTSYEALKSAHAAAAPVLRKQGIRCLKQGDDDRSRLLQTFLQDQSSVLFATDSFWEGVDAPGDTLRLVILCRLPFRAPGEPVFQARCEALKRRGGSSFMDLSLPEAVMKFKQGFGRLMRRSSDRGVVAVLDSRIIHKRYGEFFLKSIPETRRRFTEFASIVRDAEYFLFS